MLTPIEEVKQKADIIDIVSRYVNLKKVGQNYRGLCPFHAERTPSFFVNPALGIFKCFGCGEGGDVIKFVQKIENISFREALEKLAKEVGVQLPKSKAQSKEYRKRQRLIKITTLFAEYFHKIFLNAPLAKPARDYVYNKRRLSPKIVKEFKIGYAPAQPDIALKFGEKIGASTQELRQLGLINEKGQAKFFNRIMFPVFNLKGQIVGFSGRTLSSRKDIAKYLNTPENPIYQKRLLLYGLYQTKRFISQLDLAIITEGQIDVLSAYQKDVKNVTAPLGTALTSTQLGLVKKLTKNVAFAFDNDEAGAVALTRATALALSQDMYPYVITIPHPYKDLDEFMQNHPNPQSILATKIDYFEYTWGILQNLKKNNYAQFEEKLTTLLQLISLTNPIRQKVLLEQTAEKLQIDYMALKKRLEEINPQNIFRQEFTQIVNTPTPRKPQDFTIIAQTLTALLLKFPTLLLIIPSAKTLPKAVLDLTQDKALEEILSSLLDFWKKHLKELKQHNPKTIQEMAEIFDQHLLEAFKTEVITPLNEAPQTASTIQTLVNLPYVATLSINNNLKKETILLARRILKPYLTKQLKELTKQLQEDPKNKTIKKQLKQVNQKLRELDTLYKKLIISQ